MKKILLPTDYSDNALNAITYAIHLFEKEECTFYILHVVQIGPSGYSSSYNKGRDTRLYKLTMEEAERSTKELKETLKDHEGNPKHSFEYLTNTDPLINAIGKNVINKDIDYIFMGTKGASGVKSIFMGSNTVSVIKNIDFCPLVAVPEEYRFDSPKEILFATDFKHDYSELELIPLKGIAKLWNSTIVLVYFGLTGELDENQATVKDSLKNKLANFSVRMDQGYADFSVATAINEYVTDNKAIGLVAMMNRKHGFFEKLTREPIIKSMAFSTEVPLFIFQKIE
ncbi:universal stress protein [Sediminicola sp. 1XM1-17]|uniref:universal stress protein n=1 Tax=Sediminicola sp. 1XM1-17 TaxID=3127702 RepID=UPI0030782D56